MTHKLMQHYVRECKSVCSLPTPPFPKVWSKNTVSSTSSYATDVSPQSTLTSNTLPWERQWATQKTTRFVAWRADSGPIKSRSHGKMIEVSFLFWSTVKMPALKNSELPATGRIQAQATWLLVAMREKGLQHRGKVGHEAPTESKSRMLGSIQVNFSLLTLVFKTSLFPWNPSWILQSTYYPHLNS